MTALLWILQVVLAALFLAVGVLKLTRSKDALLDRMGALEPYRPLSVKLIGLAEVLGAVGLVLPPLVGAPGLVPWAALGLAFVMVAAVIAHAERSEWSQIGINVGVLALALVVVYGRSPEVPFPF